MDFTDFDLTADEYIELAKKFAPIFDQELKETGCPACGAKTAGLQAGGYPVPFSMINQCCPGLEESIGERFQSMMREEAARLGRQPKS